nr:DNA adenine methylase [Mesoplasma melaleucae]
MSLKPILKWVGGKRRFIKKIEKHIDKTEIERYIELFFESGALFFHLGLKKSIISDLNFNLMNFYKVLAKEPLELKEEIDKLFKNINVENYKIIRETYNGLIKDKDYSLKKAAFFLIKLLLTEFIESIHRERLMYLLEREKHILYQMKKAF